MLAAGALAYRNSAPVPEEYASEVRRQDAVDLRREPGRHRPVHDRERRLGQGGRLRAGKRIHLVRNPSWDKSTDFKPAYLDEIDNLEGNDDTTWRRAGSSTGKSMINGDCSPPPEILKQATQQPARDQIALIPARGDRYVSMNTTIKPFDNINVRKAVIAGFDRQRACA